MENDQYTHTTLVSYDPIPATYSEALPIYDGILAIDQIDVKGSSLFSDVLQDLFANRNFTYQFRPPEEQQNRVRKLYFSLQNDQSIKTDAHLDFGYPILIKRDNKAINGLAAMPIFFWSVTIEPDKTDASLWSISGKGSNTGKLNPSLRSLSEEVNSLVDKAENRIYQDGISSDFCTIFCQELSNLLSCSNDRPTDGTMYFPSLGELLSKPQQGQILWPGIIANLPEVQQHTFIEACLTKEYWDKKNNTFIPSAINFDFLTNDHYQQGVADAANKQNFIAVEAPTGTGKTHTILNLLVKNLIKQQSTLIIGTNEIGLTKIANRFAQNGLQSYSYHFKNLQKDKQRLIDLLIPKVKAIGQLQKQPSNTEFDTTFSQYAQLSQQLTGIAAHYGQSVFDINNRAETIGLFMKHNKSEKKDLLNSHLDPKDFQFNMLEMTQISAKVVKCSSLFTEINGFKNPLDALSRESFLYQNKEEAREIVEQHLRSFITRARKIQQTALVEIGLYKDQLETHFYQYDRDLGKRIKSIEQALATSNNTVEEKETIFAAYNRLQKKYGVSPYFEFNFSGNTGKTESIPLDLKRFKEAYQTWRQTYPLDLKESAKFLTSQTAQSSINFKDRLVPIEQSIELLIKEINAVPLFKESVKNNGTSLPLQVRQLEDLIEQLNYTLYNLRDFDNYYGWRQHWQTMNLQEQKVVKALIAVRPANWENAFKSWYYQHLLQGAETEEVLNQEDMIQSYHAKHDALSNLLPAYLRTNWAAQSWSTLNGLKETDQYSSDKILGQQQEENLADYYQSNFELVKNFFPIQLMTTATFEKLNTRDKAAWDNVIIINPELMTREAGASVLTTAQKVVVFGSGNQGLILATESFWGAAKKIAGQTLYLKQQHQLSPISLLHFTNVAYQQYLQLPDLAPKQDPALQGYYVKGTYDHATQTNIKEAVFILDLLTQLFNKNKGIVSKVGIACATIAQRDYIAAQLLDIQQTQSAAYDIIQAYITAGLTVLSFEDIQGQSFDTVIVSLTFGQEEGQSILTKDYQIYNTPKGEIELQNLLTCDTRNLYVCNSIPIQSEQLNQLETAGTGLHLYFSFLDFVYINQKGHKAKLKQILEQIGLTASIENQTPTTTFNEEVANHLRAYFEPERISTNTFIGIHQFPIIVKGTLARKPSYIIIIDNFSKNTEAYSFNWQRQVQTKLEAQGYRFIQIWSRDWWKNPEEEARQLAKFIIRADKDA